MTLLIFCAERAALLPLWDAWCPDDGRLAAAAPVDRRAWVALDGANAGGCGRAALTGAPGPVTLTETDGAGRHVPQRAHTLPMGRGGDRP